MPCEQAAAFLYRYVTECLEVEPAEVIALAVAVGLFKCFKDSTIRPKEALTRALLAELLTVLSQKF